MEKLKKRWCSLFGKKGSHKGSDRPFHMVTKRQKKKKHISKKGHQKGRVRPPFLWDLSAFLASE
jgi:hypothetical protein